MPAQPGHSHAWTHDQRVCLHILWEEHSLSKDERARVFNGIFKDRFAVGESDHDSRSTKALSVERAKRHRHGSHSWKAWQAVGNIADDAQKLVMVDGMRRQVNRFLKPNSDSVTIQRTTSTSSSAQTTALLCDVEKFAKFTESVTRKRNFAALCTPPSTTDESHDSLKDTSQPNRSCHTVRGQSPTVMIPKVSHTQDPHGIIYVEESSTTAGMSTKGSKTVRHATAVEQSLPTAELQRQSDEMAPVLYQRMGNMPLMLSPTKYKKAPPTEEPYTDVSEQNAHPWLPSLLWRYWDSSSQGHNSANGFKSGRSAHARVPPRGPPLCKDLEWMDVLEHLNPSNRVEHRIHTPFISTSSRLLWLLRKALRKQDPSGCVSVIDSSVLDPQGVYYVPPFHTELKKRFVFNNGAQYYKGISEHLVWNEIPSSAMIKTISLDDFCAFVNGKGDVKRLMRLNKVASRAKLDEISRMLKRDCVKITDSIAVAIAELVMFFGLDHTSCRENLSHLVYEIAQGWALTPESVAQSSWQTKAKWFTHTICRRSDEPVDFTEQSKIYDAFLDGIRWSCGDVNVRLKGHNAYNLMQKRAAKVGLDYPSHMVISELESAIVTTQLSSENNQSKELGEVNQAPDLAQATEPRRKRAKAHPRQHTKSSFARRPGRQVVSKEGEVQCWAHGRDLPVDSGESNEGNDHQANDCGGDEDGSEIVVTGIRVQSLDPTPASSSWSEDEIVYE